MKSYVILTHDKQREIPEEFKENDNRFPESLVEYILNRFTKKGDKVLDIFAGLGTTLFVAEEMDRIPFGIEFLETRYQYIAANLKHSGNIIHGDSRKIAEYDLPKCDLCFSSPTFMDKNGTKSPLSDYKTKSSYQQYLHDLRKIYTDLKNVIKLDSYIIIDTANLKKNDHTTTLAFDIAREISQVLHFCGEIIIVWKERTSKTVDGRSEVWRTAGTFGYGYDHSYCLIFRNK